MCFSKPQPKAETPAAAPAPALEPADAPEVGDARRKQSEEAYGDATPNYRVNRTTTQSSINPNSPITM